MRNTARSMATMAPGQRAVITAVTGFDSTIQRLMSLGLVEGAAIEMAGAAIGGDPLEFRLYGCGVSVRREQAKCFLIDPSKPVG